MWNLISHFLTFAGGMASGVMLMCLMQTGKLADKEFETMGSTKQHFYFRTGTKLVQGKWKTVGV